MRRKHWSDLHIHPYTAAGRLNTRTWARGITTTYHYNPFGTLAKADYSDATADVDYTYDRMGHPLRITGATTYDFVVTANGLLVSEEVTNPAWNHFSQTRFGYDSLLRRTALTNLTLGSVHTFGYDEASRLASVSFKQPDGDISAQYGYLQGSSLIDRVSFSKGGVPKGGTQKIYDYANRVRSITSTNFMGVTNVWLDFGYNAANQVVTRVETDSSYWDYGYDQLGQVTNGWRFLPNGSNVLGQTFNYQFDEIGNRRIAQTGGDYLGMTFAPRPSPQTCSINTPTGLCPARSK